eukprot:GEMP01097283.1.p1 GENE.GEMP01097283.1~~GEMP01097283.1.p1  ORF type:complete len:104 (-),score=0.61 GEMP01097283.1:59-370(-)
MYKSYKKKQQSGYAGGRCPTQISLRVFYPKMYKSYKKIKVDMTEGAGILNVYKFVGTWTFLKILVTLRSHSFVTLLHNLSPIPRVLFPDSRSALQKTYFSCVL